MDVQNSEKLLSLNERVEVIRAYPLFSKLMPEDLHALASLCEEEHVAPGKIIVNEGDPVDAFYFIVSGAAEVTRNVASSEENKLISVATLSKGDTIGLSQEGFFSATGVRTGTVVSALSMTLLRITLQNFYHFLQQSHSISPALKNTCENILLINFIKKTHLFRHLTKEKIQKLIEKKRKIEVPAKTIIFKEGEVADQCYFILSGKIAILSNGKQLAILETSSILGEGAFIAGGKRNADACALTDSELFVLDKKQIKMITSKIVIDQVDAIRIKQLRPLPNPNILIKKNTTPEKEILITLENPATKAQLQLFHSDYVLWKNLDGHKTLDDILKENPEVFKNITLQTLYARVLEMSDLGFLDIKRENFLEKWIKKIRNAW